MKTKNTAIAKSWVPQDGDHEDCSLVECDTVQFGTLVPTFQCNLLPLYAQKNDGFSNFDDIHMHSPGALLTSKT